MTDRYTKATLTVIAGALIALVVQNFVNPLSAQSSIQKVVLCDPQATNQCASLITIKDEYTSDERHSLLVSQTHR
jgi:hypothetical protein